jgi:hypothetical protein
MNVIVGAFRELYGLFVDDGAYALAIVAWIVIALALLRFIDPGIRGIVLFAGCALILIAGVTRASRG